MGHLPVYVYLSTVVVHVQKLKVIWQSPSYKTTPSAMKKWTFKSDVQS